MKVKKISLNILEPIKLHNNVYSLVGIYYEKAEHKHKRHKLCFTRQQRTDNNGLVINCCILHKIIMRYIKIPQVVEFPDFSPARISVHFIPYRKDKIRTVRKNSGRLVTLLITLSFDAVDYELLQKLLK
jgi:hypothetical protein